MWRFCDTISSLLGVYFLELDENIDDDIGCLSALVLFVVLWLWSSLSRTRSVEAVSVLYLCANEMLSSLAL